MGLIANSICEFRYEYDRWPSNDELFRLGGNKRSTTLFGIAIDYDPESVKFDAPCPHDALPVVGFIRFTGYYSGCSGHGVDLRMVYEQRYRNMNQSAEQAEALKP
jgi:hypothetical protein